jgi:DNA modification methylase
MAILFHENCEARFASIEPNSIHAIITDVPYNVSEITENKHEIGGFHDRGAFQRYYGEWDKGFCMETFVQNAHRVLVPGGWLITFCSDRLIGPFRDFTSCDFSTVSSYLLFLSRHGIIDGHNPSWQKQEVKPPFNFKATVTWSKTNPPTSVRKSTLISDCEYIMIARKTDDGKPAQPVAWNWLGTKNMWNIISGPLCQEPERIYWHVVDNRIIPCKDRTSCLHCKNGIERQRHGTQKPLYMWRWIFARYTKPGLTVYDPYAGLATGGWTAKEFGLNWFGSELDPIYAQVGQMMLEGTWRMPVSNEVMQCSL